MEYSSLVFGVVVGIIAGVIAQEATISVNQAIVVKPTPNPLTDPADRVDITLQCIGSRTDLSYYIKNQITWEFKDHKEKKRNLTTSFYPAESSAEYFRVDSGNPHYDLTYTAEGNGFKFALKIIRVTYSDDGVYTCSLLQGGTTVIDQKTVQVTVVHPVDSVKLSLKQGDNELFSAMQPAGVNEAANKLKPGNYKAMCQAEGSNPEPEIHLMMNGEKYSNAPITMKSVIDNQRPSYMKKIDKTYDLTHREMEQVLSCEANIPGGMYQPQVASMKLKVQIVQDEEQGSPIVILGASVAGGLVLLTGVAFFIYRHRNRNERFSEEGRSDRIGVSNPPKVDDHPQDQDTDIYDDIPANGNYYQTANSTTTTRYICHLRG